MKLTADEAWAYWNTAMKAPRYILAPMVNASDLPYRLLCRKYGVDAAYTPMLHSRLLSEDPNYRSKLHPELTCLPPAPSVNEKGCYVIPESWTVDASTAESLHSEEANSPPVTPSVSPYTEKNTIAQLCGHDPATVVAAGKLLEDRVVAIDLNCGCPQGIARRGQYGSFLLSQPETIIKVVSAMVEELRCPVTVKIRIADSEVGDSQSNKPTTNLPDEPSGGRIGKRGLEPSSAGGLVDGSVVGELVGGDAGDAAVEAVIDDSDFSLSQYPKTVELVKQLESLGVLAICVHGRTPQNKGHEIHGADWVLIRELVRITSIPIIANGSVHSLATADACLKFTGAAAVMSAEALLEDPSAFRPQGRKDVDDLMLELIYLNKFVAEHSIPSKPNVKPSADIKALKSHLFSCLYAGFQQHHDLRNALAQSHTVDAMEKVVMQLKQRRQGQYKLGYYRRHRKLGEATRQQNKKARTSPQVELPAIQLS